MPWRCCSCYSQSSTVNSCCRSCELPMAVKENTVSVGARRTALRRDNPAKATQGGNLNHVQQLRIITVAKTTAALSSERSQLLLRWADN